MSHHQLSNLPYDITKLPRELKPFYISASEQEIQAMLKEIGLQSLDDLYNHIPADMKFSQAPNICRPLKYDELKTHIENIAAKNNIKTSFIGDGLKNYHVMPIVDQVSNNRGLATAYTPYQPERSQGSLMSLHLYSSALSALTGFEAINASMYDRATCLFEALNTSTKIIKGTDTVIVLESNYPGDIEVIKTLAKHTTLNIIVAPLDAQTGLTNLEELRKIVSQTGKKLASVAFPQINSLGNLEDVHSITDLCHEQKILAIAVIDPILLSSKSLIPPTQYGSKGGAHILVAEGQHLAIGPNFGGPGLGIFGIRYNDQDKNSIRSTPGRYIGKAVDEDGNPALCMVLSTREQHIRRDKAGSNICSNESFIATLAGASLLERGASGLSASAHQSRKSALKALEILVSYQDIKLAYPATPFFNEFCLSLPIPASEFIKLAQESGLHVGVDVSDRTKAKNRNNILMSFSDLHTDQDLEKLNHFLAKHFSKIKNTLKVPEIPSHYLRSDDVDLPSFAYKDLAKFYDKLGKQNISPDNTIYPLGSCTMKYNPFINEYAANLKGFTDVHPQAPETDTQGCLEILYEIQEMFKRICGLPGVALQPVAGAQGELTGIKMFQAYHKDNNETRDIILIPKSAHGTNPATATMAGFISGKNAEGQFGIVEISADKNGHIDMTELQEIISKYGRRISGIMVTNPNTSGIFEVNFKKMADLIHSVGGLVYMDGANMNAIAGWLDLSKMGVDAVHNNLHKTWSIPHGGGGPGDAIVAVSEKLVPYIPGIQVKKQGEFYSLYRPEKSIGSFHRHYGNFAHKVRAYTYLRALGSEGVKMMSAVAVLSARYLFKKLHEVFPTLPAETENVPRMHEFILTLKASDFENIQKIGIPKASIIAKIGKLFLDFGLHAPTVAFPEVFGLMIEPTESFTKSELDRFVDVVKSMRYLIDEHPEVLNSVPHFTPVKKVNEVEANKTLIFSSRITSELPEVLPNLIDPEKLGKMTVKEICQRIVTNS